MLAGSIAKHIKRLLVPTLVVLFPFLYHLRLVVPNSALLVLENDFGYLYHVYKAYLVDAIAHGNFPLWSPAEGGGYGFFANPFAAPLYPLNVLPLSARLAFGNYNYWFHQIFTVLGVSIFALGIYRWLYQTSRQQAASAFAAILISSSWCVGLFMRFPNAIHTIAWVPWVLCALQATHRRARKLPLFGGMLALICEITAGYPYFVVYSFFLYFGYAVYLHLCTGSHGWRSRALRQALLIAIPTLLTLPYTSAVSHLMGATTDRGGGDFAYAISYGFGPVDLIGSLVYPPVVTIEGCFYTGTLSVFLLVLYLHRGADSLEKFAWLAGVVLLLGMILGHRSYLFTPIWSVLPVFNQMRAFSRMTIILLPLLAAGIHHGFLLLQRQAEAGRRIEPRYILGVFGTMLVVQAFFMGFGEALTGEYGLHVKPRLPPQATELDFVMYTVLTLGVVLIVNDAHWRKFKRGGLVAFGLLLLIATLDVGNQGRFLWTRPVAQVIGPGSGGLMARAYERAKHEGNLYPLIENYFELDRYSNEARLTANGLTKVPMPNFYFERYVNFYQKLQKTPHVMQGLMGKQKLYFHTRAHDDPETFLRDVNASRNSVHAVRIVSFDGDNLELRVVVDEPGYLTWLDNWDAGWTAELNGQPSDVLISLGTFKTIGLPRAGEHSVRFSYSVPTSTSAHVAFLLGILMLIGYGIGSSRQWRSRRRAVG